MPDDIVFSSDEVRLSPPDPDPEMVAIARGWVEQRIAQYRDQKANPLHTWAWRMYADLCEIVQFDPLDHGEDHGSPTPCENYTARSWSPGSDQPEDARCANCDKVHGPAVGGSESRVAPGQLADEERSAPPTDSAPDIGSEVRR